MRKDHTQIVVILDRSGSMEAVKKATIDGFNEFLHAQQQLAQGTADLRLVQFDTDYELVYDRPLDIAPAINNDTFIPRGGTALHDAMGRTIRELGRELAALPESGRPDKVIIVTLTDGAENSSHAFTREMVAEEVQRQRDVYKWEFVFLGANQDAVLTAKGFNIPATAAMTYNANATSVRNSTVATSNYVSAVRGGQSAVFSEEDRENAKK